MKIYTADRTSLNILRCVTALVTIILLILCRQFIPVYIIMITLMTVFSVTAVILIFFYLPAMFRNIEIYIGDNIVQKRHGVFFRREQTINLSSVQFVTTAVCIFGKLSGFNFIILNIYGGFMVIPFLSHKDFKEILPEINKSLRK